MDVSAALQKLGLNRVESAIYLYLTQNGPSLGADLQTALAFQKVPTYRALKELKARGYIESLGQARNQRFAALPLATLLSRYDEQVQELRQARAGLESFMARLVDQQSDLYKQNNVKIYEGREGYRLWNEERIGKDVDMIRECGPDHFLYEFFSPEEARAYMLNYIDRRLKKNIPIRIIHDTTEAIHDYDRTDRAVLKETHAVPLPPGLTTFMSIFGNRFGFYTRQNGRYVGVIIDDPMMTQLLIWFFDNVWQNGKKV
ncbi:MAG TPA: helix-turn-helix domain-containing protein [Candidatus Saccharimonadales bacterium]|nr:helix-turn-helix domain-containing protein [Candidatus Saccharimonadales bacterium]